MVLGESTRGQADCSEARVVSEGCQALSLAQAGSTGEEAFCNESVASNFPFQLRLFVFPFQLRFFYIYWDFSSFLISLVSYLLFTEDCGQERSEHCFVSRTSQANPSPQTSPDGPVNVSTYSMLHTITFH